MALAYYALSPDMITDLSALFIADSQFYRAYWQQQQLVYRDAWNYFTGIVLQNTMANAAQELQWPLRVNLVKQAVLLHSLFLWGVHQEGGGLVDFIVQPKRSKTAEGKPLEEPRRRAKELAELLNGWLRSVRGPALLREQGRLFIAYGGSYLSPRPDPQARYGIGLSATPAEYCYPVWDPVDYSRLIRMHVARRIPVEVAEKQYGYNPGKLHSDVLVDYIETWTEDTYSIQVGLGGERQTARDPKTGRELAGGYKCQHPVTGKKRLPWVYIPRLRTGRFYGDALPQTLFGIQDEYNTRMADIGDATLQITHPTRYGTDLAGPSDLPITLPLGTGEVFNAGRTMPGMEPPKITDLKNPEINQGVTQWADGLLDLFRQQALISDVMVGLDEGSQRSGETLNIRAIPTTATIQDYRDAWAEGLRDLGEIFLMLSSGLGENGVEAADFDHAIDIQFAPILPKERSALVEEQITLKSSGLRSRKLAITRLGDVPDVDDELAAIKQDEEEAAKLANQGQEQKMAQDQAEHQQKMKHMQEQHQQKMAMARQKVTSNGSGPRAGTPAK